MSDWTEALQPMADLAPVIADLRERATLAALAEPAVWATVCGDLNDLLDAIAVLEKASGAAAAWLRATA